jgi:hypothetical protein
VNRRHVLLNRFRPGRSQTNPPNCPPTSVLLVLKMKFYIRYLLCTQRDSEGRKLRDQAVGAYCHEGREPLELMECKLVPGKQGRHRLVLRFLVTGHLCRVLHSVPDRKTAARQPRRESPETRCLDQSHSRCPTDRSKTVNSTDLRGARNDICRASSLVLTPDSYIDAGEAGQKYDWREFGSGLSPGPNTSGEAPHTDLMRGRPVFGADCSLPSKVRQR